MQGKQFTGMIALGLTVAAMSPSQAQLKTHTLSGRIGSGPAYFTPVTGSLETGNTGISIVDTLITYDNPLALTTFNTFTDLHGSPYDIAPNTTVVFDKNDPLFIAQANIAQITDPHTTLTGEITFFDANQNNLGTLPFAVTNFDTSTSVPEPGSLALGASLLLMSGGALLKRRQRRN